MGPTIEAERIDGDDASLKEFVQRLEDAVERTMSDLNVEQSSRTTLHPCEDEPMTEPDER